MPNRCLTLAVLALLAQAGCSDATGSVSGGQPLVAQQTGGPPTWTALYKDFFGPSGQASCSAQSTCHGSTTTTAYQISGFLCGTSKESCWEGMTLQVEAGVPIDGGAGLPALVPSGAGDPTKTPLYLSLHQASSSSDNALCNHNVLYSCNMPCGDPVLPNMAPGCHTQNAAYTFTQDDLTRIATWIQQGAQDN